MTVGRWLLGVGVILCVLALVDGGASAGGAKPVLAAEPAAVGWKLVRLDPLTLRRVGQSSVALGSSFANAWDWSPARTRLAIGNGSGVMIVDPVHMSTIALVAKGAAPEQVAWLSPGVLIAVSSPAVTAVDPRSRQLLWRRILPSTVAAIARWQDELVFVLEPTTSTYGTATLLTLDTRGKTRSVSLDEIHAGEPESGSADSHGADPGLAVDPKQGIAYVVGGGDPIAKVDLRTMNVSYAPTREPAAAMHGETGPTRTAVWAGDGILAVSGFDEQLSHQNGKTTDTQTPAGLTLINTRTWTSADLNRSATSVTVAGGVVLGYGIPLDIANGRYALPTHGDGLSAYTPTAKLVFHVLAGQPISSVQISNGLAYLPLRGSRTAVIRLRDGRRIATAPALRAATLLTGSPLTP